MVRVSGTFTLVCQPISMIRYFGLLLTVGFFNGLVESLDPPTQMFIPITPCKLGTQPPDWCEWGAWSSCMPSTCTRTRTRQCACPGSPDWHSDMVCDTSRPQDDYMSEDKIIRHTRYVRRTTTGEPCHFPFMIRDKYFPDCIPRAELEKIDYKDLPEGEYFCKVEEKLMACETDVKGLAVVGMEEKDVGACSGWSTTYHRRTKAPQEKRLTYGSESELGMHCSFYAGEVLQKCSTHYFYGERSASDYGRLTNLAFDINNCRFACAIRRECQGIEFVKGVSCTLIMDKLDLAPENYLGVTVESKSDECTGEVLGTYPFRKAVALLESNYRT